jgi:hypothetical protein
MSLTRGGISDAQKPCSLGIANGHHDKGVVGAVQVEDLGQTIIIKGTNYSCTEPQGLGLEKDILACVSHLH